MNTPTTSNPTKKVIKNPYLLTQVDLDCRESSPPMSPPRNRSDASTKEHAPRLEHEPPLSSTTVTPSPKKVRMEPLCLCCGLESNENSLCIVWNHHGKMEPITDIPAFRYTCCDNLHPHPCFVGKHVQPGESQRVTVVQCHCGRRAAFRRTHSPQSPNEGRYYYVCRSSRPLGCEFFSWADAIHGLPKVQPTMPADRVRQWLVPEADPFGEGILPAETRADLTETSKRVLASLMIQWLVLQVAQGKTQATVSAMMDHVATLIRTNSVSHFLCKKMTQVQIEARIGVLPAELETSSPAALRAVWQLVRRQNPVVRATITSDGDILSLHGLHTYYHV